jgi:hypothetical protein
LLLSDKKRADEQRIENKLGMCLTSISFWKKEEATTVSSLFKLVIL